jgi:3-deoxy-D-manno-octulosonic-acid transferase
MSESSFRRYRRIRGLIQPALQAFDLLALQSEKDAERFRALGSNAQRLKVTGNVKFDGAGGKDLEALRAELRLGADQPVWVAGSTRPGEEEIVLEAFTAVHAEYPEAVLVLAPRHLERLREVQKLLAARQWTFTRRSRIASELLNFPVILLDTMGELARVYALGRVAFVGGTLVPLGGHNPLEPAIQGVPVLMGPHYEHFAKVTDILKAGGGAQIVHSAQELANAVLGLLRDPDQARARGKRARQAVLDHQGAAAHTAELLQKLMLIRRWGSEVSNWRQETTASGATDMVVSKDTLLEDWPEWPL